MHVGAQTNSRTDGETKTVVWDRWTDPERRIFHVHVIRSQKTDREQSRPNFVGHETAVVRSSFRRRGHHGCVLLRCVVKVLRWRMIMVMMVVMEFGTVHADNGIWLCWVAQEGVMWSSPVFLTHPPTLVFVSMLMFVCQYAICFSLFALFDRRCLHGDPSHLYGCFDQVSVTMARFSGGCEDD